jgi:ubiquinone/menaquinone biosynthesis C-methylase UbiE
MGLKKRLFAANYDRLTAATEEADLRDRRRVLLAQAHGRVLEIGGGTGANLPYYGEAVTSLAVTEPEESMARQLERRAAERDQTMELVRAPAEELPFESGSFDFVVSTLVLCSVTDQPRALEEALRVLKRNGQLLFLEHVRSQDAGLARWQDRLNWLNRFVVNCDCNRPTLDGIEAAGFTVDSVAHGELSKAPPFARPLIVGVASPSATSGGEIRPPGEPMAG